MKVGRAVRAWLGSPHCGDAVDAWPRGGGWRACVVDGLGHGPEAEVAARAALAYVTARLDEALPALFAGCDEALRPTRGAAMGVADVHADGSVDYAAVGNTRLALVSARVEILPATHGIVGAGIRNLRVESARLAPGAALVLYTDGLPQHIDFGVYSAASRADAQRLAGRILIDWARDNDDAGVLVLAEGDG